ncbi:MAG: hypothetical protein JW909_09665 [Planctomycetes bacterium]|nr:hypothetical protein [Planctomycetota bacterium]
MHPRLVCVLLLPVALRLSAEQVPEQPAPRPQPPAPVAWRRIDERILSGRNLPDHYLPHYVIKAGRHGATNNAALIRWHFYADEPEVDYRPDSEYLLDSSRVCDRWIRLSERIPHVVMWNVSFLAVGGAFEIAVEPNGVVIGRDLEGTGISFDPAREHSLELVRSGSSFTVTLDGADSRSVPVDPADRTPLQVTAQVRPVAIRSVRLSFGNSEDYSDPPVPKVAPPPRWNVVYRENFSNDESVGAFELYPNGGRFERADGALYIGPAEAVGIEDVYCMLKMSLPGDLRVRFRARSMKPNQPPFFGLLVSLGGSLRSEDGYFVEWNYWQVQVKKRNRRVAGVSVSYPRQRSSGDWLDCMMERVGGVVTMYTEGERVLTWTDPYPYTDNAHDLFCFYTWRVPMQFDDIVIERNAGDRARPRSDHPVFVENYLNGRRDAAHEEAADFFF